MTASAVLREAVLRGLAKFAGPSPALILAYHSVGSPSSEYQVSLAVFEKQMQMIAEARPLVTLNQIADWLDGRGQVSPGSVCLTFDDVTEEAVRNAAPVLERLGLPATWFVASGLVGKPLRTSEGPRDLAGWDGIASLLRGGFQVGAHSVTHALLDSLPLDQVRAEVESSRDELARRLGIRPVHFAYPKGRWTRQVAQIVRGAGYRTAVTVAMGSVRPASCPYFLPRVVVGGTTSLGLFKAVLTEALDWYESRGPRRRVYRELYEAPL